MISELRNDDLEFFDTPQSGKGNGLMKARCLCFSYDGSGEITCNTSTDILVKSGLETLEVSQYSSAQFTKFGFHSPEFNGMIAHLQKM